MGKFRSKLKGQTKGKRWPKGQSSSSNPETRKYRDQAKSRFFQENIGASNLTFDALKKHDAIQSFGATEGSNMEHEETPSVSSYSQASSYQTLASFASEWSECSNMSYKRFLNVFRADSALHKEMLAILAAITEVIKQNGGSETPTEYFCSLLTTLETVYNTEDKNEHQITAVLSLINMGIKTVPEGVLKTNFNDVVAKMLHILNDYVNSDNNTIVKCIFGILSHLLRIQDLAVWSQGSTIQIFNAILNPFCIHSKPKWRKGAQQAVTAIVKASNFLQNNPNVNPPADKVAEFCENTLDTCLGGNKGTVLVSSVQSSQTTILHTLGLAKETICSFSNSHIKKMCEIILRLMTLNYPLVTSCGLQVLHALFSSQSAVISPKLNAQLISALYEYQPSQTDVQPTLAWLLVMQQAHVHLADIDLSMSCAALPRIFEVITNLWLSERNEIMTGATHALEVLLKDAVGPACVTKDLVLQNKSKIEKCFATVQAGLSYQFNRVWHQVLHTISVMFEASNGNCNEMLLETLKSLAELRDSYKFSYNGELEFAVGAAIRTLGPEFVLSVISLKKENGDLNIDRSWLLPVLKENIKSATLRYFREGIFPLARYCHQKSAQLAQMNDGIGAHSSELLYMQLWNLLPCFCNSPTDIKAEFKNVAKLLGTAISDRKELRLSVMAALRKLISSAKESDNSDDISELARFDKNYLPILFNVYTVKPIGSDEEGQRLAALDTIKIYLTIARPELTKQLFANGLERLNSSSEDPEDSFIKESILDLIRALVPYQNSESITLLYQQCVKSLPELKNNKEQKKAYRILEVICSSETDGCKTFVKNNRKEVQRLMLKSLNSAAVSSKGARLRCLNYLLKAQPQLDQDSKLIKSTVPEAIMCTKDINEKCRKMSFELLNTIGDILLNHKQMNEFVAMVMAGLAGPPQMMSCTVLAMASILYNFSGTLGTENTKLMLENVCTLNVSPTREIVDSCLSFIKVFITSLPSPLVGSSLEIIVKSLCGMTDDCKRKYRIKVRDILDRFVRKYGCDSITPFIPLNDTVMYKRLRNLRKLNSRKKRMKEERKNNLENSDEEDFAVKSKPKSVDEILADSDSDFDDDDMETDQSYVKNKNKNQSSAWIEEDPESIVDFTDPTVASKITATKPGKPIVPLAVEKKKEKDRGFKTSSDGRLIITANSDDDEKTPKKKDTFGMNSDTDDTDDDLSIAETLKLTNNKRKRAESVKSGASSIPPMKYRPGGVGIHRNVGNSSASVKSGYSNVSGAGSEYQSKKAKGDVKRKGKKLDPYAYIPLKRSTLNKRKKMKSSGQFRNIVKGAKAGALKGAKAKKNRGK